MLGFVLLPHTSSPEQLKRRLNYILFKIAGISVQNFFKWWEEEAWKESEFVANSSVLSFCPLPRRSKNFLIGAPWASLQNSHEIPLE